MFFILLSARNLFCLCHTFFLFLSFDHALKFSNHDERCKETCLKIILFLFFQVENANNENEETYISHTAAYGIIGLATLFVLTFRIVTSKLEKCRREAISSSTAIY